MTVERYEAFAAAVPGTELVALGRAVEEIRMAKDEQEIALIARACEITSRAFEEIVPLIRPGVTERELAISLERAMIDLGGGRPGLRHHRGQRAERRDPASRAVWPPVRGR